MRIRTCKHIHPGGEEIVIILEDRYLIFKTLEGPDFSGYLSNNLNLFELIDIDLKDYL